MKSQKRNAIMTAVLVCGMLLTAPMTAKAAEIVEPETIPEQTDTSEEEQPLEEQPVEEQPPQEQEQPPTEPPTEEQPPQVYPETNLKRPIDMIFTDELGRAYILEDGVQKVGKFLLSPNFMLGDVNPDNSVNASDAATILEAVAKAGAAGQKPETFLPLDETTQRFLPSEAFLFADVEENGVLEASDAAAILIYSAQQGSSENILPMGTEEFLTDSEGFLHQGLFQDGEKTYYTDEKYHPCYGWQRIDNQYHYFLEDASQIDTGWQEIGGNTYYFDENGASARNVWMYRDKKKVYLDVREF